MFIASKNNIILPSGDGSQSFRVPRGFVGNIPDWAARTPYFNALVKDGKITVPKSKKDKDICSGKPKNNPADPPSEPASEKEPSKPGPEGT